ncbi:hypothetical protein T484DRAFT_3471059, partial [Baffinella frigidus]
PPQRCTRSNSPSPLAGPLLVRHEHTKPNAPIDPSQRKESDAGPASQDATLQAGDAGPKEWITAKDPELTTGQELSVIWKQSGKVLHESLITPLFGARGGGKEEKDGTKSELGKGEVASVKIEKKATIWRVISLVGPERKLLVLAMATTLITTPATLFFPVAVGTLLDMSTGVDAFYTPTLVASALMGAFITQGIFMSIRDALLAVCGERMAARLRVETFAGIVRQETAFFDKSKTGELINRLASDVTVVQKAITNNVTNALRAAGMVLGGTAMMIFTSPKLALVSLLVIPPGGMIAVLLGRFMRSKTTEVQDSLGRTTTRAEEVLSNVRVVRQFGREAEEVAHFRALALQARDLATSVGIANALLGASIHSAANLSLALVLGYGGTLVIAGEMTSGGLTSFLLYSVYVGFNSGMISTVYAELMKAVGASSRIFALIDREPTMPHYALPPHLAGKRPSGFEGRVEFRGVGFHYPRRPDVQILDGFSLNVLPGQVVGLVGQSGSGKSTLGALLTRLYDPQAGMVTIDGWDTRLLDSSWIRKHIAVVPQEPTLFAGTIEDNIRYGNWNATHEEIIEAAKVANAHSFTSAFPNGYKTLVGERGAQLSGGQKQRIAIARAVLKNPTVLLLDEATSALDSESEGLVQEALQRLSKGRTVIKIAHRLNVRPLRPLKTHAPLLSSSRTHAPLLSCPRVSPLLLSSIFSSPPHLLTSPPLLS